ncbi:MAG: IS200/IS605 family transposase [Isosphaeraceae bacterium]
MIIRAITPMPQSLALLYVHFIFSTKERVPLIDCQLQPRLFEYMGGILEAEDSVLVAAGGMPDHVHLLVSMGRESSAAGLMRLVKTNTSLWIHGDFPHLSAFAWQVGYGAFSVSASRVHTVKQYIDNQSEHHKTIPFQDEYRAFLRRHGIGFDERYLWD